MYVYAKQDQSKQSSTFFFIHTLLSIIAIAYILYTLPFRGT